MSVPVATPTRRGGFSTEAKVGLFFFLALGLVLWFTLFVTGFTTEEGSYHVKFTNVMGLGVGSNVFFNGIKVGKVRRLEPSLENGRPMVAVWFDVEEEYRPSLLISDSTVFEVEQGMLGGSSMVIYTTKDGQPIRQKLLDRHVGKEPVSLGDAMRQFSDLVTENRSNLKRTIDALPGAVKGFNDMASEVKNAVAENRDTIKLAIQNFAGMSRSVREMVEDNRQLIADGLARIKGMATQIEEAVAENRENLKAAITKLPVAVEQMDAAAAEIEGTVAENRENLKSTIAELRKAGPKITATAGNLATISDQIVAGEGTIGRLVMEEELYDQSMTMVQSANQRLEEVEPFTSGFSKLKFYVGLDGGYNTESGRLHGLAYLRIEPRPWKFYEAGAGWRTVDEEREDLVVEEDPEDLNIDLHVCFGWRFFPRDEDQVYWLSLKGGLIEGAFGGQADVALWDDRLFAHVMARDRQNQWDYTDRRFEPGSGPIVRTWLEYRVWKRVYVYAGGDDLVDDPAPYLGIRAELLDNDIRNFVSASNIMP